MGSNGSDKVKRDVMPNPYSKKSSIIEINKFTSVDELISKPKMGKRQKARIFCNNCNRYHHLHWGEFKHALKENPSSLQEIIDIYAWKYCGGDINDE